MARKTRLSSLLFFIASTVAQLPPSPTIVVRQATSSSPSLPLPTLAFQNQNLQAAVVCSPLKISWLYTGPAALNGLSLYISNYTLTVTNLTDTDAKVYRRAATPPILISSSLNPASDAFVWPAVTVPQGWYFLTAVISNPSYSVPSSRFLVSDGGNTSCIRVVTSSSSIASRSSTATSHSVTPSHSSVPPPTGTTSNRPNVAAIAGGVVGGVILLLLSLSLCIFLNGRSRRSHSFARYRFNKEKFGRAWGGLASDDSHAPMGGRSAHQGLKYPSATTRRVSHTASHASFVSTAPADAKYGSSSQEDTATSRSRPESSAHHGWRGGSPSEEKSAASVEEMELEGMPTLGYPNNKPNLPHRSHSTSSFASELNMGQQRRPSDPQALMTDTVMDPPTLSPTSPASPPSSVHQQRKTPRKPVPAYTSSFDGGYRADPLLESPLSLPPLNVATNPISASSPVITPSPTTNHYTTRMNRSSSQSERKMGMKSKSKSRMFGAGSSQESVVEGGESDVRDIGLVHKSSFGPGGVEGKPLHFLVPDILPLNGGK